VRGLARAGSLTSGWRDADQQLPPIMFDGFAAIEVVDIRAVLDASRAAACAPGPVRPRPPGFQTCRLMLRRGGAGGNRSASSAPDSAAAGPGGRPPPAEAGLGSVGSSGGHHPDASDADGGDEAASRRMSYGPGVWPACDARGDVAGSDPPSTRSAGTTAAPDDAAGSGTAPVVRR